MSISLYPHQVEAVEKLENGSILCGGVGSGKSRTGLAYFFLKVCEGGIKVNGEGEPKPMKYPMDLYIITPAKKRDSLEWETECARFCLSNKRENSFDNVQVTIDSWNNIKRYADVKRAFFIFDEQRLVGSGEWVKTFLKIAKENKWILLSATPGDTWMDYVPVFVANGFYRNRTEFAREHVVYGRFSKYPKVEKYIGVDRIERLRRQILVEMPFVKPATRHVNHILVGYDKDLFDHVMKDRWNPFEDKPIRETGEYFHLMRKVVNSDARRLGAIMELAKKHPRLIIFYNFNYELEMLRWLGRDLDIPLAEWNGHKHEQIPDTERWIYLVQYSSGSDAWNCILTDAMVFYSLNYSYRVLHQAEGRIDRLDTPFEDLYYYILRSNSRIDQAIMKSINNKKTFNEKNFEKE